MTAADHPTVPHPDLDTLADLDAGVLDPAAAEDVAAHVGGCARCAAAMAAFDAVRADLGDLPVPAMPESVAARLDATVADLRAGAPASAQPGAPVSAPATRSPAQQLGLPPQGPPPPHLPQAGGPQRPPEPPRPVADLAAARQRRRRSIKLSTTAAAAAFVLVAAGASVAALVDSANEKGTVAGAPANADNLPGDPAPTKSGSGSNELGAIPSYTKASLPGALESINSTSAVQTIEQLGEAGPGGAMANRARRQACIASIQGSAGAVTAFRRIDFERQPAYVFVFTNLATGDRTAKVVTMDCGMTGALPATVLDEVR